jgi:hypothetical protein
MRGGLELFNSARPLPAGAYEDAGRVSEDVR